MSAAKVRPGVQAVVRKFAEANRALHEIMVPPRPESRAALTTAEVRALLDQVNAANGALVIAIAFLEATADVEAKRAAQPKRPALSLVKEGV